jgi:hypothetical protein
MILQRRPIWLVLSVALFLAGCGGGANSPFAPGVPIGGSDAAGASGDDASFVILVPHKARHRGSRYVSPNTKSISIALQKSPSGKTTRTIKQNLTPASKGCVPVAGGTQCTIDVLLKSGEYTALISTYDAVNQGGNVLSQDQSVPFKILKKKVNTVSFVLGGVPHTLSVSGATRFVRTTSNGVSLFGPNAGPVAVTAKDADGNTIVGPDSLHYSAAVVSGGGWKVQATPNPSTPNTFSITPPGTNGASASIKITFAISSATCAQSGVVCTKTFTASNRIQLLATTVCGVDCGFTGATDSINIFKLPNITTPIATVTNGVFQPLAVAFAPNGTLFVANCKSSVCPYSFAGTDSVTVYAPPYTGSPVTITSNIHIPALLSVNKDGDLFVDDCQSCNFGINDTVTWYLHGAYAYQGTLNPTATITAMKNSPSGDLMVGTCAKSCGYANTDAVLEYSYAMYPDSPTAITDGVADVYSLAFDDAGNMLVGNCATCGMVQAFSITKYAPGGTSPIATITGGSTCGTAPFVCAPISLAADSAQNIFVGNGPGGATNENIAEFLAPSYGGDGTLFFNGVGYQPFEMLIDGIDDVIVSDTDSVQLSSPPYSSMIEVPSRPGATSVTFQGFALSP